MIQCVCMCDVDHAESVSLSWGCGGFLFSPPVNFWGLTAGNRRGCSRVGGGDYQLLLMMCPVSVVYSSCLLASLLFSARISFSTTRVKEQHRNHTAPSANAYILHILLFIVFNHFASSQTASLSAQKTKLS